MYGTAIALVLGSGVLHSVWNLYTKRSINKNIFLWFCQLIAMILFLPWAIAEWDSTSFTGGGAGWIVASMAVHGLYVILLAAAYSVGDMSQVYPIMRGTSPLLVPIIGVLVLGEHLHLVGWAGVLGIVIGIGSVSGMSFKKKTSRKAPLLALAVGICIASYIIIDKIALEYTSAVVLNEATNVGNFLILSWAAVKAKGISIEWKTNWRIMLLGGLMAPGGYLLFLYALSLAPVSQLAPMREIGTVFGTLMGIFILQEEQGKRRIAASLVITAGVILLGFA
ncbi:DMT family transporter [Paenibacillus kobensis]|uniref:DMT family transporter n=1 Tax=Paenibacillus kobensis TaxID=59841 RepID=UPI000FD9C59F|nr:DMT family transporter [Paenibacillus kobensis]